jgi:hypothetical protein
MIALKAFDNSLLARLEERYVKVKFVDAGKLHRYALGKLLPTDSPPMPRLLDIPSSRPPAPSPPISWHSAVNQRRHGHALMTQDRGWK